MLKHILVPLDGSELSEQALSYAQDVMEAGGRITLVSVIELPADYDYALVDVPLTMLQAGSRVDDDAYNTAYARIESYLLAKVNVLKAGGFNVDYVIEAGVPADVIIEQAKLLNVRAIVMSTHGRTGLSRWLFGSVTQKVIAGMPCPVMVVPGVQREALPEKSETGRAYT